ncbi:helix-turn-helix domain-containing protein, partial [Trichococcus ilyis]
MTTQKHLTLEDRYAIQHSLEKRHSFRTIARSLDKDPTSISKEVRRHRQSRYYVGQGRVPNRCIHRQSCAITNLCANKKCRKASCSLCNQCNSVCAD